MIVCTLVKDDNVFNRTLSNEQYDAIIKYLQQEDVGEKLGWVIKRAADYYNVLPEEMKSKSRDMHVVKARNIVMYHAIKKLKFTTVRAGKIFDRDHATAIHARKNVETKQTGDYLKIIA